MSTERGIFTYKLDLEWFIGPIMHNSSLEDLHDERDVVRSEGGT